MWDQEKGKTCAGKQQGYSKRWEGAGRAQETMVIIHKCLGGGRLMGTIPEVRNQIFTKLNNDIKKIKKWFSKNDMRMLSYLIVLRK